MSLQFKSGGGGGMQTVGYEDAHLLLPGSGGGGGDGGPAFDRQANPRIGWSSITFGATPVCPWKKSKKATPTTRARGHTLTALRACRICFLRSVVAFAVQNGAFGASAIMW